MDASIPDSLPPMIYRGYSHEYLRNKERNFPHKTHVLDYCPQGFRICKPTSAQVAFTGDNPKLDCDQFSQLIKSGCLNPEFYKTHLDRRYRQTMADEAVLLKEKNSESAPVLRFYAYRVDGMAQEKPLLKDNWRVRKFVLYFYTADKTIKVWENREVNSGFTQGVYLQRRRYELPGKENVGYSWFNLDVGLDVDLCGHLFHIYDCDEFTRHFFEYNGASVKKKGTCPVDPYLTYRSRQASHVKEGKESEEDELSRFIRMDGQILSFEVVVDDSLQKAGDIRRMLLRYYTYDEALELIQIPTKNSGYNPASVIIRRQKIPKNFYNDLVLPIGDKTVPKHYIAADLKLGETLLLLGRKVTICDCDEYTKKWFTEKMQIDHFQRIDAATLLPQHPPLAQPEISPWHEGNRQGGYLDSLQNCLQLDPRPKVYNNLQKLYYAQECLRYQAKLVTQEAEEKERRFIIYYYIGDESVKIIEEGIPSLNIAGGTFLSRRQLRKVGSDQRPIYLTERDFTMGSLHEICGRLFEICNCDQHVVDFARQQPDLYSAEEIDRFQAAVWQRRPTKSKEPPAGNSLEEPPAGNSLEELPAGNSFEGNSLEGQPAGNSLEEQIKSALGKLKRWKIVAHQRLYQLFFQLDLEKTEMINVRILRAVSSQLGMELEEEILRGILGKLGAGEDCILHFPRFLHALDMWKLQPTEVAATKTV